MSDGRALAREFLEQQRLLGGSWTPIAGADRPAPSPVPEPRTPAAARAEPAAAPEEARADQGAGPLDWPDGVHFDPPPSDLFTTDPVGRAPSLDAIAALVATCTQCPLCAGRRHTVPGEGAADARLLVVGEGPGRVEDETGRPFVGPAGELLTKILAAIELPRSQVFICNIVKCRPPENRQPVYEEVHACLPYLYRQIELVAPRLILALGATAAQSLLSTRQSLGAMRQRVHRFRGIPVLVTYHPAALLRNPNWKRPTWDDVRIARRLLD